MHQYVLQGANRALSHHELPYVLGDLVDRSPVSRSVNQNWFRFTLGRSASTLIVITSRIREHSFWIHGIVREHKPGMGFICADGRASTGCTQVLYFGPSRCTVRFPLQTVLEFSPNISESTRRQFSLNDIRVLLDSNEIRERTPRHRSAA